LLCCLDLDGLEAQPVTASEFLSKTPVLDNLSVPELVQPIAPYRGEGDNAPYQYKLLTQKYGVLDVGHSAVQQWAIRKEKMGNGQYNVTAHRLFKHFLVGGGAEYVLTSAEWSSIQPYPFNLAGTHLPSKTPATFLKRMAELNKKPREKLRSKLSKMKIGGTVDNYSVTITAGAQTNGTLGEFAIDFKGKLTKTSNDTFTFDGTMTVRDTYDFDLRVFDFSSLRSGTGSSKVRKVRLFQVVTGNGVDFKVSFKKRVRYSGNIKLFH